MIESGPIRKTQKEPHEAQGFCDFMQVAPNVWRATEGSRYWLLKCAKDNSTESVELLRREYELACDLQHPFIALLVKFTLDTPKGPAIVMEYVEGRTLNDFICEEPDKSTRKKVLEQILDAVEHIHSKGLLHNDIKPENILITNIGNNVKIIDFGLSETPADYLNRRLGGTTGASAPEVLSGDTSSTSNGSADIYALGGILAKLFPNKYRFIRNKCLKENPEARYQDIPSLRAAIASSNRRVRILLAFAAFLLFTGLAIYISNETIRKQKEMSEETMKTEIQRVQDEMTAMYRDALDNLSYPKSTMESPAGQKNNTGSNIGDVPLKIVTVYRDEDREEALQVRIKQIQEGLTAIYKESIDSLTNPNIVPFQDFALPIIGRLIQNLVKFRKDKVEQAMLPTFDSVNWRLDEWRSNVLRSLPTIYDLHEKGILSDEEETWYFDLARHNKPYVPFSKKNSKNR